MLEKIVFPFLIGLVLLFIGILSNKYVKPILPESKEAKIYLRDFVFFLSKYIVPLGYIVYHLIYSELDKFYVISIVFWFGLLVFNISSDVRRYFSYKITDVLTDAIRQLSEEIIELKKEKN